ncbi:hypothetical protein Lpp7_03004 [Lacticaseibacillus paracasei subsp. paracasei Lpp7]|uniref:Uncharacterized protein n=1 Tax=Lacticaseibacillus paracasei subsp. paracasei Lpp7 TaxID=1256200 RepID=A0A8E0IKY3_LACPA|nr:hypothetical protein Lpp7_03004 [Lacticaseibacillus paracasei subsp. paracasei Lpp7]
MSTQSVVETVTALVKPILDDHHFYLTDVEFVKEGGGWYCVCILTRQAALHWTNV